MNAFLHESSSTISYLVVDEVTKSVALIDPVADYDISTGKMTHSFSDKIVNKIRSCNYNLDWIIETHVHADHVSDAQYFKSELGGKIAIGGRIKEVQETFASIYDEDKLFPCDGSQFDYLISPDEIIQIGELEARAISTPGHTPACASFLIGDVLFTGDALFMPDFGTGRCDFPNGSANDLFDSIHKLYALPDDTRVFVGHDYCPGGRELRWETTIEDCKNSNKHVTMTTSRETFIHYRTQRDATLNLPRLLFQSVQINIRAGTLPNRSKNGNRMMKIPIMGD